MPITKKTASELGKKSSRKGIPNKTNEEIRKSFQYLIECNTPKLQKWIERIAEDNPDKALMIIIKLSEFVLPKLNRTEISASLSVEKLLLMTPEERQNRILELQAEVKN